jgi:hypothetical protein
MKAADSENLVQGCRYCGLHAALSVIIYYPSAISYQLLSMSEVITKIVVEEHAGVERINEPVRVGVPFPRGLLQAGDELSMVDPELGTIPVQTQVLAEWPDKSPKWVLFDFQVSVRLNSYKGIEIRRGVAALPPDNHPSISVDDAVDFLVVQTGRCTFFLDRSVFGPFGKVVSGGADCLNGTKSGTVLIDEAGAEYEPLVERLFVETKGKIRSTIKAEGRFRASSGKMIARFFARLHFFANSSVTKIEFTVHNPRAARHPGGLWDLGDPGSIFFKDVSLYLSLPAADPTGQISYTLNEEPVFSPPSSAKSTPAIGEPSAKSYPPAFHPSPLTPHPSQSLSIYQDSSGGENWRSSNHVNRNGEVKTSFRGYRVFSGGEVMGSGNRANPIVTVRNHEISVSAGIRHFWQNFPKAIGVEDGKLIVNLFPGQYADLCELQGGEQKTHEIAIDFASSEADDRVFGLLNPLIPRAEVSYYESAGAFPYLCSGDDDHEEVLSALIQKAVEGDNTFFDRREIIDEYGWRNFGDMYADHEAINHQAETLLVSHYNNQYDCIFGALMQFAKTGNHKWFILADQLCKHVRDIDIYHTDQDRPEFNHGLFWHTEHYIDAQSATHRCFSRRHAPQRNLAGYGGGPSLSHNYSTGLLFHYYMTGEEASREAVMELGQFVVSNMQMEATLSSRALNGIKRLKLLVRRKDPEGQLVNTGKVYGLDGPGRASGNSLETLLNAYGASGERTYLDLAESLIRRCISPDDDIEHRELLDIENRWMYTVFLQALGRYLDLKDETSIRDDMWVYGKDALLSYAQWMAHNEHLYLERPDKLEFPNETWAAQDLRKCNIFLFASRYCSNSRSLAFKKRAEYFLENALKMLQSFDTAELTRPVVLCMLNGGMHGYFKNMRHESRPWPYDLGGTTREQATYGSKMAFDFSLERELKFIKWRLGQR